jgi:hypothetical protein
MKWYWTEVLNAFKKILERKPRALVAANPKAKVPLTSKTFGHFVLPE